MKDQLLTKLKDLEISYQIFSHEPLFTVEQALQVKHLPGKGVKNLFLKDKKGNLFLVVALHDTVINLKFLAKQLPAPEVRFASADTLKQYLGVTPGAVTPLGVICDHEKKVFVVLDKALLEQELVQVHPLCNDETLILSSKALVKFIESCGNNYVVHDFCINSLD